jgi:hypothetical protein
MLLADLKLSDLPIEVLISIRDAAKQEIRSRHRDKFVDRSLKKHKPSVSLSSKMINVDEAFEFEYQSMIDRNGASLQAILPSVLQAHPVERIKYLPSLLKQNWDYLFDGVYDETKKFYVYAHIDPRPYGIEITTIEPPINIKGTPFYIGKGCGNRAWDLKRNQGHGKYITNLRNLGFPDESLVQLIFNNISEKEAYTLEAKMIYFFGSIYEEGRRGFLCNLADHIRPVFKETMERIPNRKEFYSYREKEKIKRSENLKAFEANRKAKKLRNLTQE